MEPKEGVPEMARRMMGTLRNMVGAYKVGCRWEKGAKGEFSLNFVFSRMHRFPFMGRVFEGHRLVLDTHFRKEVQTCLIFLSW